VSTPTPTIARPEPDVETRRRVLPPYRVVLHNDDYNTMDHVVRALVRSIHGMSTQRATLIMLEAHFRGRAEATICPLELAELYRDRLRSYNLTATVEPV